VKAAAEKAAADKAAADAKAAADKAAADKAAADKAAADKAAADAKAASEVKASAPAPKAAVPASKAAGKAPASKPWTGVRNDVDRKTIFVEQIDKQQAKEIKEPVRVESTYQETVYVGNIDASLNQVIVQIDNKCKAITISGCQNVGVVCTDVVARIEIVNCKKLQVQVQGVCPIIQVDKTERSSIFLSDACLKLDPTTSIYSSACSGVNIISPNGDEGDTHENAIPEQFKSQIVGVKMQSHIISGGSE